MHLDSAVIQHYKATVIPWDNLVELVKINRKYLGEKKTWYNVNGQLEYFKKRDDLRLFTELFFQEFAYETLKLDTLSYRLAYIREVYPETLTNKNVKFERGDQSPDDKMLGLLSENFQVPENNYFLVSELLDSECSDLCGWGGFSLMNLLNFFKIYVADKEYAEIKDFLIRLFIIDALLLQADRNAHNIGFEIPKIEGLSHSKRLRPKLLLDQLGDSRGIVDTSAPDLPRLIGFKPSKVYDNERILDIDHNNVILANPQRVWAPLFPYNDELLFTTMEDAELARDIYYDGIDPNLLELCFNHYGECKNYVERLAKDDIWRKILEGFTHSNDPIILDDDTKEHVEGVITTRQKEFKKVLTLFK